MKTAGLGRDSPALHLTCRRGRWRDLILLQMVVLVWSFTAILGKYISLQPLVLVSWRTLLAAAALVILTAVTRISLRVSGRALLEMTGAGALLGLHWFLFFLGGRVGTVSVSLVGLATIPLWVALLEPLMVRSRRWNRAEMVLAAGVTGGVFIIQFSDRGLLTGIGAALVAAVLSIINGRLTLRHPAMVITFYEMTGAFAVCLGGALILHGSGVSAGPPRWLPLPADWPPLLLLALVCTVFAFSVCVWLQQRVSAFSLGMASNLEPIYGMALAALFLGAGEAQGLRFYLGSGVIIGCVLTHGWLAGRRNQSREPIT